MIRSFKPFNLTLFIALFLLSFNGSRQSHDQALWLACYNPSTKKIHFDSLRLSGQAPSECSGSTSFKMKRGWQLIQNSEDNLGYGELRAGTKKTIVLPGGRRILVAQWESPKKMNLVTVLEPNLKHSRVKKHCIIPNGDDAFSAKYDARTRQLKILLSSKNRKLVWRSCQL